MHVCMCGKGERSEGDVGVVSYRLPEYFDVFFMTSILFSLLELGSRQNLQTKDAPPPID